MLNVAKFSFVVFVVREACRGNRKTQYKFVLVLFFLKQLSEVIIFPPCRF